MKVLSGHVVTKSQAEDSMDLFIIAAPAVHVNSGPSPFQQASESNLINSSHAENINRRRWRRLFRRVQRKNMDSDCAPPPQKKMLFGRALSDICEKDDSPPRPIMDILSVLWRKGPHTIGLFRKAGNAKRLKEIKEQLNSGAEVDLKDEPVILLADLLKDFLRHLPDSLLIVEQYKAWMAAMERQDVHDRCTELRMVINKLPEPNIQLLKHLIAVLYRISLKAEINKMDSSNLAVCVSPNLLQADRVEVVKNVSNLTQFLIDNCGEIFSEDILTLLGDSDEEELSDNQDSMSSLHHDSAYDSNDPDGSFTDMHAIHSDAEEKTLNHFEASSCPVGRNTPKPFIRRCSEPTFGFNKSARNQSALTRSQTEMDFYDHHLTKQISDECVLFRTGSRVSNEQRNTCVLPSGEHHLQNKESKDSCSSLESTFSSASENSIQTSSPIISSSTQRRALLRKQSFPTRLAAHGSEATKKRSQSMKASSSRNKTSFSQGASKRVEKALRQSQTLPEVLLLDRTFLTPQKPCCLSSEEVFHQVDSRIPSKPPSYEQAIQDNAHMPLSHRSSLTVEAARCLSKNTCCQSTFPTAETSDSCSVKDCSEGGEKSPTLTAPATSAQSGQGSISVAMYEACSTTLSQCRGQQMLGTVNVRESYV
ncbi:T cell activation RhoGTPase activating protein a [Colossoma macropomum]|uniref:T cell activation RhoGTPase activating protein a n=1 Tax=Colossoma macropomum TaxID=42526 RepID=UPI0018642D58|nr:T cell activation RhoGTPase activating protein a [Colossoma macropomum]